jgi:hypothetical protein
MSEPQIESLTKLCAEVTQLMGKGEIKTMPPHRLVEMISEATAVYPIPNMAVDHCVTTYTTSATECLAKGEKNDTALKIARMAYCLAMPKLSGADNLRDFVACVTHGMLIGVIPGPDATRLLYAAQVARTMLPKRRKSLVKMLEKNAAKKAATSSKPTTSTGAI